MRKYCLIVLFFISFSCWGQSFDLGTWNVLHLKYNPTQKLSLFAEAQLRSLKFYKHFHFHGYTGGIHYKVHKNVRLSLGVGNYQTYQEGGSFVLPKNNNEITLWPQLIFSQSIWKIKIEQRYRAEFRWTSNGYRNRFRYRLGLFYPFGKERKNYKPYQIAANNELFFTDKEPYFERNRVLIAFDYKPTASITLQLGYLHQFDYRINDEIGRNFLVLGFYYDIFRKKIAKQEKESEMKDN